jgi:aspartyl-tRNA(Asn)/glutamyl-tRNA(Gln) amidotransferase subunit A
VGTPTIEQAAARLRDGSTTAAALTKGLLAAIDAANDRLGAYVTVSHAAAIAAAEQADAELAAGNDRGPLHGIPLAVKDIIATEDAPTTANSRVLAPDWGAGVDAGAVARLRAAGAVIIGKATTNEFACGDIDPSKGFRVPRNPWQLDHSPSGSSSGTGVAVAAGLALGGLGTDTGGSIRRPSAANGITGLKPTYGLVPTTGVVPFAASLDVVGPMARTARDCALLLDSIADGPAAFADIDQGVAGLRIGLPIPFFFDSPGLDDEVRVAVLAAVDLLGDAGADVREIRVPFPKQARDAAYLAAVAEGYAYHHEDLTSRWADYGRSTRLILARGALYSAGDLAQARLVGVAFRDAVLDLFADVDVIVTPTLAAPAERLGASDIDRGLTEPRFTDQWNLVGLPALAVPCGFSSTGLPLSFQLIGAPFADARLLATAADYQSRTDWHEQQPEATWA